MERNLENIRSKKPEAPSPWPTRGPDFNRWNLDAAGLAALLQATPTAWLTDSALKYVTMRIDTRSGAFLLSDADMRPIDAERVTKAVSKAREQFGEASGPDRNGRGRAA